jgi:glutamine amidotransferase
VAHPDDSPIRDDSHLETPIVAIFEYAASHADKVANFLATHDVDVYVTSNWAMCLAADGLIIPGGNSPEEIAREIKPLRAAELIDARLLANRSVLAIGNAFNLLFETDEASDSTVFNQWPGVSQQLESIAVPLWCKVDGALDSHLFSGVETQEFLFEAPRYVTEWKLDSQGPMTAPKVSWAKAADEVNFIAAIENGPLVATQFHPENSGKQGNALLTNWIRSL